jgi:RND family efflux transporter MFP subunit
MSKDSADGAKRKRTEDDARGLSLPAMSRGMQVFALTLFFLGGVMLTAFALINPLGLSFLPSVGISEDGYTDAAHAEGSQQLYQCPMHPEVIEPEQTDCPICYMKLMPLEESATAMEPGAVPRKILYWYAPMDPTYIRNEPGLSPMGMKLVPKYDDEPGEGPGQVRIDPAQIQNIGVVSQPARLAEISRDVRTVGILDFNADRITWVNTKFSGWIEKVYVSYVGQEVQQGQPLFEIYSPELVTTQEEYLRALEYAASMEGSSRVEARRQAESLLRSTRDRLEYWDISQDQIQELDQTRVVQRQLTVRAPVNGVVAEVMEDSLEGMFVKAGMNLYRLADLSTIWVHADVYESDLPWVHEGQPAEIFFRYDPDRLYSGRILFLYPEVSKETRTLKICVEVPNEQNRLKAGMYTDVILHGPPIRDAIVISRSAVLRTGERDLVFVDLGEGRFEPREVRLGVRGDGDDVQIVRGVAAGERVVTQAQFMLDSESRVQEAIAKFRARSTEARSDVP